MRVKPASTRAVLGRVKHALTPSVFVTIHVSISPSLFEHHAVPSDVSYFVRVHWSTGLPSNKAILRTDDIGRIVPSFAAHVFVCPNNSVRDNAKIEREAGRGFFHPASGAEEE